MRVFYLIVLLFAFSCQSDTKVSGEDGSANTNIASETRITTLFIEKMVITKFPSRKSNNKPWDTGAGKGPDMFYTIEKGNQIVYSGIDTPIKNFDVEKSIPHTFMVDYTSNELDKTYAIMIYDKDVTEHDIIDGFQINPSELPENGKTATFTGKNKHIEVTMHFEFR